MPLKIAILASGNGTNAQAIIDKARTGILDIEIGLIFSNRPDAGVLARAKNMGIPHVMLDHKEFRDRREYDRRLVGILQKTQCQLIVLAGYMRLLGSVFLQEFAGRVINIHPALLPSFPGTHGAQDAFDYGVKITGASVHFVEEQMDSGPLIIQAAVPVNGTQDVETLQERIHAMEHRIYPQALQWIAEGRVEVKGHKVYLAQSAKPRIRPDGDWLVSPPLEAGF